MSATLHVELSKLARQQVRAAAKCWRINRTKAPNAVREELARVSALISLQPSIGALARDVDDRIHYYVYYRVTGSPEYIEILVFWSSLRGSPPEI